MNTKNDQTTETTDRLLNVHEVSRIVALSRTTIHRLTKEGKFPQPVRVPGSRAVRWSAQEVSWWMAGLKKAA
jgi:prophage regulatory protein